MGRWFVVNAGYVVGGPFEWDGIRAFKAPLSGTLTPESAIAGIPVATAGQVVAPVTGADTAARLAELEAANAGGRLALLEALNLGARLTAQEARTTRLGAGTTPAILLGASADVTVAWASPMPSASYSIDLVRGDALVGRATVALKSQTAAGCVVTVTAGLAVALNSTFVALART